MTYVRAATRRMELDRATVLVAGGVALLALSVVLEKGTAPIAAAVAIGMALVASQATVLRWPAVVILILSVMLFVPIGRYSIPINLPFELELYRLAVAIVLAAASSAHLGARAGSACPLLTRRTVDASGRCVEYARDV